MPAHYHDSSESEIHKKEQCLEDANYMGKQAHLYIKDVVDHHLEQKNDIKACHRLSKYIAQNLKSPHAQSNIESMVGALFWRYGFNQYKEIYQRSGFSAIESLKKFPALFLRIIAQCRLVKMRFLEEMLDPKYDYEAYINRAIPYQMTYDNASAAAEQGDFVSLVFSTEFKYKDSPKSCNFDLNFNSIDNFLERMLEPQSKDIDSIKQELFSGMEICSQTQHKEINKPVDTLLKYLLAIAKLQNWQNKGSAHEAFFDFRVIFKNDYILNTVTGKRAYLFWEAAIATLKYEQSNPPKEKQQTDGISPLEYLKKRVQNEAWLTRLADYYLFLPLDVLAMQADVLQKTGDEELVSLGKIFYAHYYLKLGSHNNAIRDLISVNSDSTKWVGLVVNTLMRIMAAAELKHSTQKKNIASLITDSINNKALDIASAGRLVRTFYHKVNDIEMVLSHLKSMLFVRQVSASDFLTMLRVVFSTQQPQIDKVKAFSLNELLQLVEILRKSNKVKHTLTVLSIMLNKFSSTYYQETVFTKEILNIEGRTVGFLLDYVVMGEKDANDILENNFSDNPNFLVRYQGAVLDKLREHSKPEQSNFYASWLGKFARHALSVNTLADSNILAEIRQVFTNPAYERSAIISSLESELKGICSISQNRFLISAEYWELALVVLKHGSEAAKAQMNVASTSGAPIVEDNIVKLCTDYLVACAADSAWLENDLSTYYCHKLGEQEQHACFNALVNSNNDTLITLALILLARLYSHKSEVSEDNRSAQHFEFDQQALIKMSMAEFSKNISSADFHFEALRHAYSQSPGLAKFIGMTLVSLIPNLTPNIEIMSVQQLCANLIERKVLSPKEITNLVKYFYNKYYLKSASFDALSLLIHKCTAILNPDDLTELFISVFGDNYLFNFKSISLKALFALVYCYKSHQSRDNSLAVLQIIVEKITGQSIEDQTSGASEAEHLISILLDYILAGYDQANVLLRSIRNNAPELLNKHKGFILDRLLVVDDVNKTYLDWHNYFYKDQLKNNFFAAKALFQRDRFSAKEQQEAVSRIIELLKNKEGIEEEIIKDALSQLSEQAKLNNQDAQEFLYIYDAELLVVAPCEKTTLNQYEKEIKRLEAVQESDRVNDINNKYKSAKYLQAIIKYREANPVWLGFRKEKQVKLIGDYREKLKGLLAMAVKSGHAAAMIELAQISIDGDVSKEAMDHFFVAAKIYSKFEFSKQQVFCLYHAAKLGVTQAVEELFHIRSVLGNLALGMHYFNSEPDKSKKYFSDAFFQSNENYDQLVSQIIQSSFYPKKAQWLLLNFANSCNEITLSGETRKKIAGAIEQLNPDVNEDKRGDAQWIETLQVLLTAKKTSKVDKLLTGSLTIASTSITAEQICYPDLTGPLIDSVPSAPPMLPVEIGATSFGGLEQIFMLQVVLAGDAVQRDDSLAALLRQQPQQIVGLMIRAKFTLRPELYHTALSVLINMQPPVDGCVRQVQECIKDYSSLFTGSVKVGPSEASSSFINAPR